MENTQTRTDEGQKVVPIPSYLKQDIIPVASIKLSGAPYVQDLHDLNASLDMLAANNDYQTNLRILIEGYKDQLSLLSDTLFFSKTDRLLKSGQMLDFDEAFCSAIFVCAYTNNILRRALEDLEFNEEERYKQKIKFPESETHALQSSALLQALSMKEALIGLQSDEIAGLVSGVLELDTVVRLPAQESVLCFGGMGGDKGYEFVDKSKLFSLSTLAAFATSLSGLTHKHHSYPNTSKVAGQTTLEEFGARSDFTNDQDLKTVFNNTSLIMTSCHNTRSIHSLSHVLRGETINHLIGPLAYTIDKNTPVQPFIGVNEKVHPQTLIEAILTMDRMGVQKYDRGVVFCGLSMGTNALNADQRGKLTNADQYYGDRDAHDLVRLDEVAPPPYGTLAGFFIDGEFKGNYLISAEDFYSQEELDTINLEELLIPNSYDDIMSANHTALQGGDESKVRYLAMTIGLANFVRFALQRDNALDSENGCINRTMLRAHTRQAYNNLQQGKAYAKMQYYCRETQKIQTSLGL